MTTCKGIENTRHWRNHERRKQWSQPTGQSSQLHSLRHAQASPQRAGAASVGCRRGRARSRSAGRRAVASADLGRCSGAQSMPAAQDVIPSFTPNSSRRVSGSTRRSASEQDARLQPVSPMQDAASAARRQPAVQRAPRILFRTSLVRARARVRSRCSPPHNVRARRALTVTACRPHRRRPWHVREAGSHRHAQKAPWTYRRAFWRRSWSSSCW